MCNAWNHWPGCTCGWGGEGHSGSGYSGGPRIRYPTVCRRGFGFSGSNFGSSSMSELAAELGHSLVFPVLCKYCGAPVYLFASPDGGFAVFDQLGPPWPKYWCRRLAQRRIIDCSFPDPRPKRYTLPVPDSAEFLAPSNGNELSGIVIGIATSYHPRRKEPLWTIDVYNGRCLYRIQVGMEFPLGSYIRGEVTFVPDVGTFLQDAEQLLPPGYTEPAQSGVPDVSMDVKPRLCDDRR
jgi:hypothetical protein